MKTISVLALASWFIFSPAYAGLKDKLTPGRRALTEPPAPVETPDVPKLSWAVRDGVKEFHLHARHTRREFLPNLWIDVWGFNGEMPGPTIEAVEGDRVRIVVHNELPEPTVIHWHGLHVPNDQDGVQGVTQDPIKPGENFAYEFDLKQNGTFFYHSHDAMQEGMGMAGLFIIHPKQTHAPGVDRDIAILVQEWALLSGSTIPNTVSEEFNIFTINGRSGPYATPIVVRQGDRVRIRMVNLSPMSHHPMHLHGHTFWVTGTEAGRVPESAWMPGNTVLVGVGQARDVEFIADNPGDWVIHCHMFHHMMNFMMEEVRGRAVSTGPRHKPPPGAERVPGYPQTMMGMPMFKDAEIKRLQKPETVGMRPNWYTGVEGLMSVVRVMRPAQYDKWLEWRRTVSQ